MRLGKVRFKRVETNFKMLSATIAEYETWLEFYFYFHRRVIVIDKKPFRDWSKFILFAIPMKKRWADKMKETKIA